MFLHKVLQDSIPPKYKRDSKRHYLHVVLLTLKFVLEKNFSLDISLQQLTGTMILNIRISIKI